LIVEGLMIYRIKCFYILNSTLLDSKPLATNLALTLSSDSSGGFCLIV
jgi:hypothetical protein